MSSRCHSEGSPGFGDGKAAPLLRPLHIKYHRRARDVDPFTGAIVEIRPLEIADVKLIIPRIYRDDRGFFSETYNRRAMNAAGVGAEFVQDNHSLSAAAGTIRGLHFQLPPYAQGKLMRAIRGSLLDVAVDIRAGSPTFGRHVSAILSAANWTQIWIPPGFAHGYCTLEPDTEVIYKVTEYYAPDFERGILWDDAELGIDWPVASDRATLSEKDMQNPLLRDVGSPFEYSA